MPFSFNPTAQSGNQPETGGVPLAPTGNFSSAPIAPLSDAPTVPDTPFLFIQQRGGDKSTLAYIQIIAATLAVLSVISTITLFAYSFYLQKSIDSKRTLVEESEVGLKEYPYDDMSKVYRQKVTLESLLKDYASARTPLLLLEKVVENEVVFDNFILSREKSGKYNMQLTAYTSNYKVLIQQLDALKLGSFAKVATQQKISKIEDSKQTKSGQIEVQIIIPLNIQGTLSESVIFDEIVDASRQVATPQENGAAATSSVTSSPN